MEAYCEELEARFAESFPEVARICVELEEDLGISLASVKGLDKSEHEKEANKREAERDQRNEDDRATRFDGDPNVEGVGGMFKPQDDTPAFIKKRDDTQK